MIADLMWLIVGLTGLWLGSELAINGVRNIAGHFRIAGGFVGLTVLSIGTSIPEIALSVMGGIDRFHGIETSGLVIGNAIGSAANLLTIILGVVGFFGSLWIARKKLAREGFMLVGSLIVLGFMFYDGKLTVMEGYVLILMYIFYIVDLTREERLFSKLTGRRPKMHLSLDLLRLVGGLLLVVFASNYVVKSGIALADAWGVTQTFVGIFVIGLGTGLPELALSIAALRKREVDMSVSNLLGSNICDLLFALGAGTVIAGFSVPSRVFSYDLPALIVIALTVLFFFRHDYKLTKTESVILVLMYFAYLGIRLWLFG